MEFKQQSEICIVVKGHPAALSGEPWSRKNTLELHRLPRSPRSQAYPSVSSPCHLDHYKTMYTLYPPIHLPSYSTPLPCPQTCLSSVKSVHYCTSLLSLIKQKPRFSKLNKVHQITSKPGNAPTVTGTQFIISLLPRCIHSDSCHVARVP